VAKNERTHFNWGIVSFCIGAGIGGLSLLIMPEVLISNSVFRILNLMFGTALVWIVSGRLVFIRERHGQHTTLRFHRLSAVCFFFGTNLIRFIFAVR